MVRVPTVDQAHGLSSEEVRARLAQYGPNRLVARERAAWLKKAASLMLDPMAIMLLCAAAVYFALGEQRDAVVMLLALIPVVGVDVFLEARSRSALNKLAQSVAPRARVIRDGREMTVETSELVPGDIIVLTEGDFVHGDGVVRLAANLALDESSLTGESEPQIKRPFASVAASDTPPNAMFYAGSTVLAGQGLGEILATGRATRFGEIARLMAATDASATPLQRRVGRLVKQLAVVAAVVAAAVVALGVFRGLTWGQSLLGGISIAMAAAPEEFPLVFTLFLSLGAWRLTRHGVLVRRLASVETLGSTTVICTDKTGTLTKGQFVLDQVLPFGDATEQDLLEAAVLACELPTNDPMEKAIKAYAIAHGVVVDLVIANWHLVRDYDFDPIGKHMSHVWSSARDPMQTCVVAKGALEGIIEHSKLSSALRASLEEVHARLASEGIRLLAVARRGTSTNAPGSTREEDERELSIVGLLGFRDPMRPEVPGAVRECRAAGVQIKIVTGDHALTAHAIAESAGIIHRDDAIITGDQLAAVPEEDRLRLIRDAAILARVAPAQKYMIVDVLRSAGEIVAMTGDGINDAPALRRADIGVSMGQRGTAVARAAADLVLLDDNFASIVAAVREGRKIFLDLQRAFLYLIAFHIPIVGLALLPPLAGLPLLLMPLHLVWLELIVHPVSALLFQGDPPPDDLMRRPPRDPRSPMLPTAAVARSTICGVLLTVAVFSLFAWRVSVDPAHARGLALATLIIGYQILVLVERAASGDNQSAFLPASVRFWVVWAASGVSLPIALYVPAAASLLSIAPLGPGDWLTALGGASVSVGWRILIAWQV